MEWRKRRRERGERKGGEGRETERETKKWGGGVRDTARLREKRASKREERYPLFDKP